MTPLAPPWRWIDLAVLQLAHYGAPDAAALAALYGFGLARNHPFVDGNKRTTFVAIELFLALNGWLLDATDANCVMVTLELASGKLTEETLASRIRANLKSIQNKK